MTCVFRGKEVGFGHDILRACIISSAVDGDWSLEIWRYNVAIDTPDCELVLRAYCVVVRTLCT